MPNASIKSDTAYKGFSRARATGRGVDTGSYYDWSVRQLKNRAKELGMSGYSTLTKEDLIYKLRYR